MEFIANLIIFAALVAAWFFTVKKLAARNVVLRHIAGLAAGVFAMLASVAILISTGLIGQTEDAQQISSSDPVAVEQPAVQLETPIEKTAALPEDSFEVAAVDEDDFFGPESQAVLDEFVPRMELLVRSGLSMEPLRQSSQASDIGQCVDLMHKNQADLRILRDELHARLKMLPDGQSLANERFETLYIAEANLIRCVTCVPTALPDCQEAAQALEIKE